MNNFKLALKYGSTKKYGIAIKYFMKAYKNKEITKNQDYIDFLESVDYFDYYNYSLDFGTWFAKTHLDICSSSCICNLNKYYNREHFRVFKNFVNNLDNFNFKNIVICAYYNYNHYNHYDISRIEMYLELKQLNSPESKYVLFLKHQFNSISTQLSVLTECCKAFEKYPQKTLNIKAKILGIIYMDYCLNHHEDHQETLSYIKNNSKLILEIIMCLKENKYDNYDYIFDKILDLEPITDHMLEKTIKCYNLENNFSKLQEENTNLKNKIQDLETELEYKPDGVGYQETFNNYTNTLKIQENLKINNNKY